MIWRGKSSSAMKLVCIPVELFINIIVAFGLLKILGRWLKSHYRMSLFSVHALIVESLELFPAKWCREFWFGDRRAIPCHENPLLWPKLNVIDVENLLFQQDIATCHTANSTMAVLNPKFQNRIISRSRKVDWPPRSCDLTPSSFFLWGCMKGKIYADKPATILQLEDEIISNIVEIENQLCRNVVKSFDHWASGCCSRFVGHLSDIIHLK